mgnify:CR=1 FL=1
MKIENSIDIVITWVDGNDPEWRSEKNKTRYGKEQLSETDDREERFRDWENLRYWFRGIENCASWVRKSICDMGTYTGMAEYKASKVKHRAAYRLYPARVFTNI